MHAKVKKKGLSEAGKSLTHLFLMRTLLMP